MRIVDCHVHMTEEVPDALQLVTAMDANGVDRMLIISRNERTSLETTQQHPCYLRYIGPEEETWHDFEYHLPGDADRKVRLAVLAFHLPKEQ